MSTNWLFWRWPGDEDGPAQLYFMTPQSVLFSIQNCVWRPSHTKTDDNKFASGKEGEISQQMEQLE